MSPASKRSMSRSSSLDRTRRSCAESVALFLRSAPLEVRATGSRGRSEPPRIRGASSLTSRGALGETSARDGAHPPPRNRIDTCKRVPWLRVAWVETSSGHIRTSPSDKRDASARIPKTPGHGNSASSSEEGRATGRPYAVHAPASKVNILTESNLSRQVVKERRSGLPPSLLRTRLHEFLVARSNLLSVSLAASNVGEDSHARVRELSLHAS